MIVQLTQPLNCWRATVAHLFHRPAPPQPTTGVLGPFGGPRPLPLADLDTPRKALLERMRDRLG